MKTEQQMLVSMLEKSGAQIMSINPDGSVDAVSQPGPPPTAEEQAERMAKLREYARTFWETQLIGRLRSAVHCDVIMWRILPADKKIAALEQLCLEAADMIEKLIARSNPSEDRSMHASLIDGTFRIGELITPETKPTISLVGATAVMPDGKEMPLSDWREWVVSQPPEVPRWCTVKLAHE